MAVLIDPPSWPAHGTVFSHLVSTSSLAELHAFAAAAGISRRAFDEDHYDVPASRYREILEQGALDVSGGELVRALIASGLRVPARRRSPRLRSALRSRWRDLLPDQPALGEELLVRWSESHRSYHGLTHLLAVLEALDELFEPADAVVRSPVLLAAWFHDAVHDGIAGDDERASAALAVDRLRDLSGSAAGRTGGGALASEVERLVLLTITHEPAADDRAGQLLCDADLAVLAGEPGEYARYVAAIRNEYADVPDDEFIRGRRAVLERLLALHPLYRTSRAAARWSARARGNLEGELASLA